MNPFYFNDKSAQNYCELEEKFILLNIFLGCMPQGIESVADDTGASYSFFNEPANYMGPNGDNGNEDWSKILPSNGQKGRYCNFANSQYEYKKPDVSQISHPLFERNVVVSECAKCESFSLLWTWSWKRCFKLLWWFTSAYCKVWLKNSAFCETWLSKISNCFYYSSISVSLDTTSPRAHSTPPLPPSPQFSLLTTNPSSVDSTWKSPHNQQLLRKKPTISNHFLYTNCFPVTPKAFCL